MIVNFLGWAVTHCNCFHLPCIDLSLSSSDCRAPVPGLLTHSPNELHSFTHLTHLRWQDTGGLLHSLPFTNLFDWEWESLTHQGVRPSFWFCCCATPTCTKLNSWPTKLVIFANAGSGLLLHSVRCLSLNIWGDSHIWYGPLQFHTLEPKPQTSPFATSDISVDNYRWWSSILNKQWLSLQYYFHLHSFLHLIM